MIRLRLAAVFLFLNLLPALAGFHGGGQLGANGYKVQYAQGFPNFLSDFPFIDYARYFGVFGPSGGTDDWSNTNANGYPNNTALSASACNSAGSNPYTIIPRPPLVHLSGSAELQAQWTGCAYVTLNNGGTIDSIGQNTCTGSCRGCTEVGSTAVYGTDCFFTYSVTSASTNGLLINAVGDGTTDPTLTDFNNFFVSNAPAEAICNSGRASGNITQLESCWSPDYVAAWSTAQGGVFRWINFMNLNGNGNAASQFDMNTPLMWIQWNSSHFSSQYFTTNTIANVSGNEYNLTYVPFGATLADRATVIAPLAATITVPIETDTDASGVPSSSCSGSPLTCVLTLSSVSGLVPGMLMYDTDGFGTLLNRVAYIVSVNSGASQITIGCLVQSPNTCSPITTGDTVANGDSIHFSPMIEFNLSGTFYPMGYSGGGGPVDSSYAGGAGVGTTTLVFDKNIGQFMTFPGGVGSNPGLSTGFPPAIMVAFSNLTRTHPYYNTPCFAMHTPSANFVSGLATFNKNNLANGLYFILEGFDEVWNTSYQCTTFANVEQQWRTGGSNNLHDSWYGEEMYNVGTTVSTVFGNPSAANRFNLYRVIDSLSTGAEAIPTAQTASGQDNKLWYTGDGNGTAASVITDVAIAPYYYSSYLGGATELALAFVYANSPSTAVIATYLDGVNTPSVTTGLWWFQNTGFPGFENYVSAYVNAGYNIRFTGYEGGFNYGNAPTQCVASCSNKTYSVTAATTGSTTKLTIGTNPFTTICGSPYSLCNGSAGSPKLTLSGFTSTNCTLNGDDEFVSSSDATSVTINLDTTSGNSGCGTGTISFDNSGADLKAFQLAVAEDTTSTNLQSCELAMMQDYGYYAANASPVPITAEFPAIYEFLGQDGFAAARYFGNIYATPGATIPAVQSFNRSQTGHTTCSP